MIELALLAPSLILGYLLWRADQREKAWNRERIAMLDEWTEQREKLLDRLNEQEQAQRRERDNLLNRIQAPEHAVTQTYEPVVVPAVGFDDDEDFWESKAGVENGAGI